MQEMNDQLRKEMENLGMKKDNGIDEGQADVPMKNMRELAIKWSGFCLKELQGPAMRKGLDISSAISDFCNHMEDVEKL